MKVSLSRGAAIGLGLVASVALAACGSSSGPTNSTSSKDSSAAVAEAKASVAKALAGLNTPPPTTGPAAVKGKNVWIVSCTQAAPGCAAPTAAVQEAAKTLGWTTTVVDGKGTPAGYVAGIQQAVAAKANGVIVVAVDCVAAKSALAQAKSAGVPVVGTDVFDCDDSKANAGPPLFAANIVPAEGSMSAWATEWGKLGADYAIATTDGKAKVIHIVQTGFIQTAWQAEGYNNEMAKCTSCDVVATVDISPADLGAPATVAQKIATVLLQHPEATVLSASNDTILLEAIQSIRSYKATHPSLIVVGGEGETSAAVDLVRSGIVNAEIAYSAGWQGYAGADAMNRVFAGQPKIPVQGLGYQIITKDRNLPAAGSGYTPTIDYAAAFKAVWTK